MLVKPLTFRGRGDELYELCFRPGIVIALAVAGKLHGDDTCGVVGDGSDCLAAHGDSDLGAGEGLLWYFDAGLCERNEGCAGGSDEAGTKFSPTCFSGSD